jgi:cytochrome c
MKYFFALIIGFYAIIYTFNALAKEAPKDKGIGPVKSLKMDPLNAGMSLLGKSIFNNKCYVCHSLDEKKVGPPLRKVARDQSPEYIMNMLLNTDEMVKKDDRVKQLFAQFKVPMVNPQLSQDQARSVLEYLRSASEGK